MFPGVEVSLTWNSTHEVNTTSSESPVCAQHRPHVALAYSIPTMFSERYSVLTLEASHFQTHIEEGDSAGVCRCAKDDDTVLKAEYGGQSSEVPVPLAAFCLLGVVADVRNSMQMELSVSSHALRVLVTRLQDTPPCLVPATFPKPVGSYTDGAYEVCLAGFLRVSVGAAIVMEFGRMSRRSGFDVPPADLKL